jgi:hypothetical protein
LWVDVADPGVDADAVGADDEFDGAGGLEGVVGFSPVRRPTTIPKAVVASAKRDVVDVVRPAAFAPMPAPTKAMTMTIAMTRFITFSSAA